MISDGNFANPLARDAANWLASSDDSLKGLLVPFKGKGELLQQARAATAAYESTQRQVRALVAAFADSFPRGRHLLPLSLQLQRATSGDYLRWRNVQTISFQGTPQSYVELGTEQGMALLKTVPPAVQALYWAFNDRALALNALRSLAYHRWRTLNSLLDKVQRADRMKKALRGDPP